MELSNSADSQYIDNQNVKPQNVDSNSMMEFIRKYIYKDPKIIMSKVHELKTNEEYKSEMYKFVCEFIKSVKTYENIKANYNTIHNTNVNLNNTIFVPEDNNSKLLLNQNNSSDNHIFTDIFYKMLVGMYKKALPCTKIYIQNRFTISNELKLAEADLSIKATQLNEYCINNVNMLLRA